MFNLLTYFMLAFSSLFSIVNPFSTAVVYEILTEKYTKKEKIAIIKKSCLTMMIVLLLVTFTGLIILKFFSLTIDALRIGGGLYLIVLSFRMLNPMRNQKELHPSTKKELKKGDDIAIVPLAIPFLSGPGAITTTIVLTTQKPNSFGLLILIGVILLITVITYIILRNADYITKKFLKPSGIKTLEKIMGLIILSIGVQFILNGLKEFILGIGLV